MKKTMKNFESMSLEKFQLEAVKGGLGFKTKTGGGRNVSGKNSSQPGDTFTDDESRATYDDTAGTCTVDGEC
ncbi:hypothetical protein QQ020_03170 [Fulvivirgaceae bacterium BMA12]|uniref:Uncharacterized protein n=1 Tax=Agaribacillus aureus TaxID=3051825 RepID=A0ABT8KZW5_9BACT|nr:hypothetical protein [Fulvivirgaceae bacterium BMA12]